MKTDNTCAKCGSKDLVRIPAVPGEEPHLVVGDRILHMVGVTKFVCANCGYLEHWVDEAHLAKLKEKYGRS